MAIIFGGDAGIQENSFSGFVNEITQNFNYVKDTVLNALEGRGPPPPPKENVHVEDGFENVPGTSFVGSQVENVDDIKQRRITSQEPHVTVYIKKRAFWGLSTQNDSRFMDDGEKMFMRASKILFEKKCSQIAAYEALTKVGALVSEDAHLDAAQIDLVIELLSEFAANANEVAQDTTEILVTREGQKATRIREHAHEARQQAQVGQGVELPFHAVLLVQEPPAGTKLHFARNRTILEITNHCCHKVIVARI